MEELNNNNKKQKIITIAIAVLGVIAIALGVWGMATKDNKEEKKEQETIKQKEQITPLMYEITREGSNTKIYLFGSMHVVNLSEFDFPKYVMDAYEYSDIVAPEFDIIAAQEDTELMQEYANSLILTDGTTIKDHLSEETYNNMVTLMKDKGEYSELYETLKPEFWESIVTELVSKDAGITGEGVDSYFLKKAKKDNKQIIDVESFELQTTLLSDFDEKVYDISIGEVVNNYEKAVNETKELYKIWKNGNPDEIAKLALGEITEEDKQKYSEYELELLRQYNYKMLDERNVGMKSKLEEFFNEDKKVFFMVGAAHLVGENGIANLLEQDGYTVKQINK